MNRQASPASATPNTIPRVPAWAVPRGPIESDVEAAYMAGSALNSLDNLVRSDPPWIGAWRHRLALKAAAASVKLMGRTEDEAALRDAWYLRQPGDELGPAGNVLAAWRKLAGRSLPPSIEDLQSVVDLLSFGWSDSFAGLIESTREQVRSGAPAPLVAARAANAVMVADPKAEGLAWWMTDLALSWRMGWPHAVPTLASQIHMPLLRFGPNRHRARPGGQEFERAVFVAASLGATEACRLASSMAVQAERLRAVAPKLRSKAAGDVVGLLIADDAVSGTVTTKSLSRWASRRLFERLQQLDAVRELSGRDTFRLYGL